MPNEGVLRGLSLAMTIQNATGGGIGGEKDRNKMNARYVNCFSNGKWAGPFINLTAADTGIAPANSNYQVFQPDFQNPFEIHTRVKLVELPTGTNRAFICGTNYPDNFWCNPSIDIRGNIHFFAGFSDRSTTTWDYGMFLGGTGYPEDNLPISAGTIYDMGYRWDGSIWSFSVSNGIITARREMEVTNPHVHLSDRPFIFGNNARTSQENSGFAMLDMDHTYIKVNGTPIWGAGY